MKHPEMHWPHAPEQGTIGDAHPDNPILAAALAYAARGWPVFPLRPGDKIPLIPKGQSGRGVHDATTDADRIRAWWAACPSANIGLAAVPFWVLDVDQPDGPAMFDMLLTQFGELPETPLALTGGDGLQFFFKASPRVRNGVKFLPGLDTRAPGGYVVAAPSLHPSGDCYKWEDGRAPHELPLADAPEWLLLLVEPLEELQAPPPPPMGRVIGVERYAAAALDKACATIAAAAIGSQADTLDRQSYGIGRLVAGGLIPRAQAKAALVAAGCRMSNARGKRPWTHGELAYRIERAFRQAAHKPRTAENRA